MNTAEKLHKMAEFDPLRRGILTDAANEIESLTAQLQAAQAAIEAIVSIGARSGTDLNAWNKAFDVIDNYRASIEQEGAES